MKTGTGRKLSYQNQVSLVERSRTSCVPALLVERSHHEELAVLWHEVHFQRPSSLNLTHYAPQFSSIAGFCFHRGTPKTLPHVTLCPHIHGKAIHRFLQRSNCSLSGAVQIRKRGEAAWGRRKRAGASTQKQLPGIWRRLCSKGFLQVHEASTEIWHCSYHGWRGHHH